MAASSTGTTSNAQASAPFSHAFRLDGSDGAVIELDVPAAVLPETNRQPCIPPNPESAFWKSKADSPTLRMRVNGETAAQMAWAVKENASGRHHCQDEPWEQDASLAWIDSYLLVVMVVMVVPKVLLLLVPLIVTALLISLPMTVYGMCMSRCADVPVRGVTFILVFRVLVPMLMLPFVVLAAIGLLWDFGYYYFFGIPLWLLRGAPSRAGSFKIIEPFRSGPPLWSVPTDFLVCVLGQVMLTYSLTYLLTYLLTYSLTYSTAEGRGIRLVNRFESFPKPGQPAVCQHYLDNPYLIDGKKFDCRIYVAVTSFDPLRAYMFEEGLARFATQDYVHANGSSTRSIRNRYMHCTE